MRKLALALCAITSLLVIVMLVVSAVTGATQEAHEYVVRPADYSAALLAAPGATRLLFAIDIAFLILYTLLFAALASHLAARGAPRLLVRLALGGILAVALLDVIEDHHILALLDLAEHGGVPTDTMMAVQQVISGVKFSLSTFALVAFGLAIPRDRRIGWILAGFLVIGTLATVILNNAAPADMRPQLDQGRWIGFLLGFSLAGAWLWGEVDAPCPPRHAAVALTE